jgi:uncharacterized protein involved in exopolysaccharide biosynthesis
MSHEAQEMTWSDYMALLRRRWRPTVATMVLVALGSIYIAFTLPPVYESSAVILIEQQGIPTDFVQTTVNSYAEELMQTIDQRVLATSNVTDMIERLDLYPEQHGIVPEDELVTLFRDSRTLEPQNVTTVHSRTGRETIVTFGFRVAFGHPDPVKARDVVAELAELYVSENSKVRTEAAARTTAFLDTESVQLQDQLAEIAERIAQFKARNENNLPENQMANLAASERARGESTQIDADLRAARERKALLETELAETPRYRPVLDDSGEPVLGGVDRLGQAQQELIRLLGRYSENHPEVINLRREIAALSASPANQANLAQQLRADLAVRREELAAARETYSESHPDVIRLQRTVRSLEEQLAAAESDIASTASGPVQPTNPAYLALQTRIATADAEIADLMRQRNEVSARIAELDERRYGAPEVEREYSALTQEQELLLVRYRELRALESDARLAETLETGDSGSRLEIIEPPRVPTSPISPDRTAYSFLGVVLAVALGLGVASLTEAMDTTVRGQRDVYRLLEMPPMGIIPYVETPADTVKRFGINAAMGAAGIAAAAYVLMTALA